MQLSLPWTDADAASSEPVVFVRHRRARRYILRMLPDGTLRVTLPRWGARRDARAFVEASRAWIAKQREQRRVPPAVPEPWSDGTRFLFDGREAHIELDRSSKRLSVWCEGAALVTLSPVRGSVRHAVEAWMRGRAKAELPEALLARATAHGIDVPRVSVRNQRSRWGACSPSGTITLNWRLMQTPPFVRDYVLLHELMHRREMNHSRRFWRLVSACCPRHAEARRWLRTEGKSLWGGGES
ncbi:MAG: M48 family metallopeptidase [Vicinamibacterales bacterium]